MNNDKNILIVDDEERIRKVLKINLSDKNNIFLAWNGAEAMNYLKHENIQLVLSDLRMPEMSGIELLQYIRENHSSIPFIIITAYGTIENAVEAMKSGAYDYILKPIKVEELELIIKKALNYGQLIEENSFLKKRLSAYEGLPQIITANPEIKRIISLIKKVALTDATILIEGESGTGKSLFARLSHYFSPRRKGPFVEINCGAIPHDLLESELFGHERGAFTGAVSNKKGKFELADNGTLFLDEIGEMPQDLQVKLLHILENQKFSRLGGTKAIETNSRIVAATNRKLIEEVKNGNFREDLYYRLRVVYLHIPPLRDHKEDIPLLINYFLKKHEYVIKRTINTVDPKALDILKSFSWPGNIRELENVVLQSMIFSTSESLKAGDLPQELREAQEIQSIDIPETKAELQNAKSKEVEKISGALEYRFLDHLLTKTKGNISEAARISGYDRRQIQNLVKKHRVNTENYK